MPYPSQTLILHWNGTTWSRVASPNGRLDGQNALYAVDVLAANNIWAVGDDSNQPIVLNWNGDEWKTVAIPPIENNVWLRGVAAITFNDVWAVGSTGTGGTLTLHWNGMQWSVIPTTGPSGEGQLYAVDARASDDVWAVGIGPGQPLALHWDGTRMKRESFLATAATFSF